jgi:HEPN domain-containing protein
MNKEIFSKRFDELLSRAETLESKDRQQWYSSVLSLLSLAFSKNSVHYARLDEILKNRYEYRHRPSMDLLHDHESKWEDALSVFKSAKEDFELGFTVNLETTISGEIFGDFVTMAKTSLSNGYKDVAAVLASAALEDALKRFAVLNSLNIDDKNMTEVINALKTQGLVSGPQKSLLESMPKLRNAALHAEWDKLRAEDVSALIGFVEQFLLQKFSS